MRAEHDHFVGFGFIRAGDFADDVEGIKIVVEELVVDIELQSDRYLFLEHSVDAAVVFAGNGDARRRWGIFLLIAAASLLHENGSVVAPRRFNPCGNAFFDEKLLYLEA